jgi:methylglyoxal synthase
MEKTIMKKQKRIALIAHDNRKQVLVDWVKRNRHILSKHFLCGTGTTAKILSESSELPVKAYKSG